MSVDFKRMRDWLNRFDFKSLFVEELGWSPPPSPRETTLSVDGMDYTQRPIAELGGVMVFEIAAPDDALPDAQTRKAIHKAVSEQHLENLLIFVAQYRTQSLWYWAKREGSKVFPRDHLFVKGQPGDLFLSKLGSMVFDISDFDDSGNVSVVQVAGRLKDALDVERTTKRFYREFQQQHLDFLDLIEGIDDERKRRWYASVLLNRLMFIYFLQRKRFIDRGKLNYLQDKLREMQRQGKNYYESFLKALFFEGFAKPADKRSAEINRLLGDVKYLNGGLFLEHPIEQDFPDIAIPDEAFENLFALFGRYSWNLDDTPGGKDDEINPDVLGYIFEKYINQKAFGAYYTRTEITDYLCERTIGRLILSEVNLPNVPGLPPQRHYDSIPELLVNLDATLCKRLLFDILPKLSLLDVACGSGAFLVAALKTLINIYSAVIGKIEFLSDPYLRDWLEETRKNHPSINYYVKKRIITDNLFGVDVMEEAVEIAKLRLFLALVASAQRPEHLEPLPNIDFNILTGNSLIGLTHVSGKDFDALHAQGSLFRRSYKEVLEEKNRLIRVYRDTDKFAENLTAMRDEIEEKKAEANKTLNEILLHEFSGKDVVYRSTTAVRSSKADAAKGLMTAADLAALREKNEGRSRPEIKFQQATWDSDKNKEGKPKKRPLTIHDITALRPFHWGYEFDKILQERGGFDAIITNPPWDIFKPNAKEFFLEHSELVSKKKMDIKAFEKEQAKLLEDPEVREAWLEYLSSFPHVSEYFRKSPQYENQISTVNGKKVGSDINLYKLFTERCFNLLRPGGQCGIVIPDGIYIHSGTKQLRELLFSETQISGLFGFENRRTIFENVDSRFKFVMLTFEKGGKTESFPAAFMRHDVGELENFPDQVGLHISVELLRRLSPDSLVITEYKSQADVNIAEKMSRFTLLSEWIDGEPLELSREFMSSSDYPLFNEDGDGLVVYEGKMIEQFDPYFSKPRWWISLDNFKSTHFYGRGDWRHYRFALRRVASSTNARTLISSVLPPKSVVVHSAFVNVKTILPPKETLYLVSLFNSSIADYTIRQKVSQNVTKTEILQLYMPKPDREHLLFSSIVGAHGRAPLQGDVPLRDASVHDGVPVHDPSVHDGVQTHHRPSLEPATDPEERAKLRAELDGLIAHLYGLSEEEFTYILTTFPLVKASIKEAALAAYQAFAPHPDDAQIAAMIKSGEGERLEFKVAAAWNPKTASKDGSMRDNIVQEVAAFMNSPEGGAVLIGVADDGTVVGLEDDYRAADKNKPNRDGYELFLRNALSDYLGGDSALRYGISFHAVDGKEVCRISVKPAPKPVYFRGDLYIRSGNGKRKLSAQEAGAYIKGRWG